MKKFLYSFFLFIFSSFLLSAVEIKSVNILNNKGESKLEFLIDEKISIVAEVADIDTSQLLGISFNIYNPSREIIFTHTEEPSYSKSKSKKFLLKNIEIKRICFATGEYTLETIITTENNKSVKSELSFRVYFKEPEKFEETKVKEQILAPVIEKPKVYQEQQAQQIEKPLEKSTTFEVKIETFTGITELLPVLQEVPSKEETFSKLKTFLNKTENLQIEGYKIKEIYGITEKKFAEIVDLVEEKKAIITESGLKTIESVPEEEIISISVETKGKPLLLSKDITWRNFEEFQVFCPGDIVRTDKKSKMAIIFYGGTELKMNNNTEIVVLSTENIKLRFGKIYLNSRKFSINTTVANISFEDAEIVSKLEEKLYVYLLKGNAKIKNEKGTALLKEKEFLTVSAGDRPSEIQKISKLPSWQNKIKIQEEKEIKMTVSKSSGEKIKFQIVLKKQ